MKPHLERHAEFMRWRSDQRRPGTKASRLPACAKSAVLRAATMYGVSPDDVVSRSQTPVLVSARSHAAYFLRQQGYSLPQIGRWIDRDHTSVLAMLKKFKPAPKPIAYEIPVPDLSGEWSI